MIDDDTSAVCVIGASITNNKIRVHMCARYFCRDGPDLGAVSKGIAGAGGDGAVNWLAGTNVIRLGVS